MGLTPLLFRPAGFFGATLGMDGTITPINDSPEFPFSDIRLRPHYPSSSPLTNVLSLVPPGSDEYVFEQYAYEIEVILNGWSETLRLSPSDHSALSECIETSVMATPLTPVQTMPVRGTDGDSLRVFKHLFSSKLVSGSELFLQEIHRWLESLIHVQTAQFEITAIEEGLGTPQVLRVEIRYALVGSRIGGEREERIGVWHTEWARDSSGAWKARRWEAIAETVCVMRGAGFVDVTAHAMGGLESFTNQLLRGADYWRTVLDGASGIDVYGNNGVAAGDYDGDGFDDLYICQPAGLPNRLYRNRGDGTFEDATEKAGVGVLDNTSCAIFADFDNRGRQDLLVVCASGPLLFLNKGDGSFALKHDAFKFDKAPQGSFTHAAVADYDRDGRLDVYFCLYSYYLGLDQYHYPVPYFDARNGPPNFLFHNEGNGDFVDRTEAAGLNVDNDRYSFAASWGDSSANGAPDIYVANDFGRANFYRNNGNGTFTSVATKAHVEDAGAGMSAAWADMNNDGRPDIYVADMWSAAGQRVAAQKQFHKNAPEDIRELYQRHARGNALYKNNGNGMFENVAEQAGVAMGRWSWCSDFWDFDHDGYADLYIANGYISAPKRGGREEYDLGSFFWRQVVGKSPEDSTPSMAYEHGWNALNELIRSDTSWNGYERNVMFANNRDGTFSEVSGVAGLDFLEDSRSFAVADLDHDGRLEVIVKNRNAPQLRILHNDMEGIGSAIAFRLRGHTSNRDAIGAAITVEAGALKQTKYLQAGSGFLAQHSKEVFFGLGKAAGVVSATIRWPSGLVQQLSALPVNCRIGIEEGSPVFTAKPFAATDTGTYTALPVAGEALPSAVETWLIEPLKAPEFSLPDGNGVAHELGNLKGKYVLLNFWASTAAASREQLKLLNQHRPAFTAHQIEIVAVNVDEEAELPAGRLFAAQHRFDFPAVFATQEIAGVYNILYRYMFDRRRDLGLPTSFLLDKAGMIVKVYQGAIDPQRVMADVKAIPTTPVERVKQAIPFPGELYLTDFKRNDFTYGVALFQHGYLDQAAESFKQVIAAKPDDPEGYYNLGTLNLRKNDFPEARKYLEQTLKLRPNYPEAWNNLGMMAAQEGRPDEAIQNFERSLQLRPGYAIALLNLGNVYRRAKMYDKAEQSLNQSLTLQPDDPEANYSLGMLYAQQNQAGRAANYLQKALELRPDYPEARNNLGILYVRAQDYPKAEEQFRICIRVAPNFDQSYMNLARLYMLQNDKEKARAALQQLLTLQPQNPAARQVMEMLH